MADSPRAPQTAQAGASASEASLATTPQRLSPHSHRRTTSDTSPAIAIVQSRSLDVSTATPPAKRERESITSQAGKQDAPFDFVRTTSYAVTSQQGKKASLLPPPVAPKPKNRFFLFGGSSKVVRPPVADLCSAYFDSRQLCKMKGSLDEGFLMFEHILQQSTLRSGRQTRFRAVSPRTSWLLLKAG